jgi:tetratricopeptide (TPR) repeat protein
LKKKIALLYKDAIGYFENNQFEDAQFVFEKILELDPDQQKARRYIDEEIPRSRQAFIEAKQQAISQAMDTLPQDDEPEVIVVEEVIVEEPPVVEVITTEAETTELARRDLIKSTLEFIESKKDVEEETIVFEDEISASKEAVSSAELDDLYALAFDNYNKGNYMVAKEHFSKILIMDPNQHIAEFYLTNIDEASLE